MDIQRYEHRVCDDGDGYTDDWYSLSEDGEYCLFVDVAPIIAERDLLRELLEDSQDDVLEVLNSEINKGKYANQGVIRQYRERLDKIYAALAKKVE